mmetsp:Transcript_18066/g.33648  ORF Transcript_18066/g.33648 Transcript_18066/m.33648 type:complete len:117 (-) Transcript_18066:2030-2380(-)
MWRRSAIQQRVLKPVMKRRGLPQALKRNGFELMLRKLTESSGSTIENNRAFLSNITNPAFIKVIMAPEETFGFPPPTKFVKSIANQRDAAMPLPTLWTLSSQRVACTPIPQAMSMS